MQLIEHVHGRLPADARVGDRHAVREVGARAPVLRLALLAFVDVRLDHDAGDGLLATCELSGNVRGALGLVAEVLVAVAVAHVDHDAGVPLRQRLEQVGLAGLDARGIIVRAALAATVDDVQVRVARRLDDRGGALVRDAHERMRLTRCADRIDRHANATVRRVLKADRHRETRHQLAVQLRLGRTRADRTPRVQVREVLWRDGIEHLARHGHAHAREIEEELARHTQTRVDLERAVQVRVVDQTLPADRGARLFKVRAHNHHEAVLPALLVRLVQSSGIVLRLLDVVDRAGTDDHEQAVVLAVDHTRRIASGTSDRSLRLVADRKLPHELLRRHELLVARHARVVGVHNLFRHAGREATTSHALAHGR